MNSDSPHRAIVVARQDELEYIRPLVEGVLIPEWPGRLRLDDVFRVEPVEGGYLLRLRDEE